MRLVVVSDSHGHKYDLFRAIEEQPDASYVIFLGDGERDIDEAEERFTDKQFIKVKGNCDFGSMLPYKLLEIISGKRIYCTHGYVERVKYGKSELMQRASEEKADIVLYGHTHIPDTDYSDGVYVMNPGSIADRRYGFIDITDSGVICVLREMK